MDEFNKGLLSFYMSGMGDCVLWCKGQNLAIFNDIF